MLADDFRNILCFDFRIEASLGIYDHDRAQCAETEATGLDDLYLFLQPVFLNFTFQGLDNRLAAGRSTSGTSADKYV